MVPRRLPQSTDKSRVRLGIRVWVRVRVYPYLYGRSPINDDDETD